MATHVRPRRRAGAACHPRPALPRYRRIAAAYGAGGKWPHLLRGGGVEGVGLGCYRTRPLGVPGSPTRQGITGTTALPPRPPQILPLAAVAGRSDDQRGGKTGGTRG